jgi:hypothetical protein
MEKSKAKLPQTDNLERLDWVANRNCTRLYVLHYTEDLGDGPPAQILTLDVYDLEQVPKLSPYYSQ